MASKKVMAKRGDETGWQSDRTLVECNRYMLDNEIATDVCFEVGPPGGTTVNIRAHKYMLMSRSPVFEAMFSSGMTESRNEEEATIRIEDIDPSIFKMLLSFIYCETADISCETAMHLMYAGTKYLLHNLVKQCCECLHNELKIENVCYVLDQSLLYEADDLRDECLRFIEGAAHEVLKTEGLKNCSRRALEITLKSDKLASSESVVFESCLEWAKHQLKNQEESIDDPTDEQIRNQLGSLLYDIRFPAMDQTEFADLVGERNILTSDEKSSVYFYMIRKRRTNDLKFVVKQRQPLEMWVHRAVSCEPRSYKIGPCTEAINFTTNKDILLTGLGLYTGCDGNGYKVVIDILLLTIPTIQGRRRTFYEYDTNSLHSQVITVPFTGTENPFKVSFDREILIEKGLLYSVSTMHNSQQFIGFHSTQCRSICESHGVTFTFYRNANSSYTTEVYGQIPRLFFALK